MRFLIAKPSKIARRSVLATLCIVTSLMGLSATAHAAGTAAGTTISNTANATYTDGNGDPVVVPSNTVTIKVDEILNVKVVTSDPGSIVVNAGATNKVMTFNVTNTGNGAERMKLTPVTALGGDQFDPTVTSIVLDNGNGIYEPGIDTIYIAGTNDPLLNPDASIKVFILSTIPAGAVNADKGQLDLTVHDVLSDGTVGTGTPGAVFAGKGNGGVDAVVGASGGTSTDSNFYLVQQASVTFVKSAVISDQFGGTAPVPGATITYTLVATVNGTGSLTGLAITDAIPANSTYQTGTLTLQGAALTDVAADDAGTFTGTAIDVALGTVAAGQTRTVTFKVKIN